MNILLKANNSENHLKNIWITMTSLNLNAKQYHQKKTGLFVQWFFTIQILSKALSFKSFDNHKQYTSEAFAIE